MCKLHIGLDVSGPSGWSILLHMFTDHHSSDSNLHWRQNECIVLIVVIINEEYTFFYKQLVYKQPQSSNRGKFKHNAKHDLILRFGVKSNFVEKIVAYLKKIW